MKCLLVLLICSSCMAASPILNYITGLQLDAIYQPDQPNPLNLPGSLYLYSLDSYYYPNYGIFVVRISAYDSDGQRVETPSYQVNIERTNKMISQNSVEGFDYIGIWTSGSVKRKGEDGAIVYPENDGYCYMVFGFMFASSYSTSTEEFIDYTINIPHVDITDPFAIQTQWRSYAGFPFWHAYYGSAWTCLIATLNGVWEMNVAQAGLFPIIAPSSLSEPATLSIVWPDKMYAANIDVLNDEAAKSIKSYTASFSVDCDNNDISIFIIGKDVNNVDIYNFCKAHKVDNQYITDKLIPVRHDLRLSYSDPNTGEIYRTVYSTSDFDIIVIDFWEFTFHWLEDGGDYDFDRNGIVNFEDYALAF